MASMIDPPRWAADVHGCPDLHGCPQQLHHNDCTYLEGLNDPLPGAGRKGPHPQFTTRTHKAQVVQHGLDKQRLRHGHDHPLLSDRH